MTRRFHVTDVLQYVRIFLVTLVLALRCLRRECLTVARHSSLHFQPHVQASVCCLSFVGSEQQTCRCSWQLWASHGLFWKRCVGASARPCDQVKKRGRWREAAVILTPRSGSKRRGRQTGSITLLPFRACGQWHSEIV